MDGSTNKREHEKVAGGVVSSLTGSMAKLVGRSIFQVHALNVIGVGTLAVAGAEYAIGAVILLLASYRTQLLRSVRGGKGAPPARLHLTKRVLALMVIIGALNIAGRGFSAFALDSPGMTIALYNAVTFSVVLLTFPYEEWKKNRVAALAVPVLMIAGLVVAGEVWESDAPVQGMVWAFLCGLGGLLYLPLSRHVLNKGKTQADQFQALNTVIGAVGLLVWALVAGESLTSGWSWRLCGVIAVTAFLSVAVVRYLHVLTRSMVRDGLYTVLSTLSLLLALGVDYIMVDKIPSVWQFAGLGGIASIALIVVYLRWQDGKRRLPSEPSPSSLAAAGPRIGRRRMWNRPHRPPVIRPVRPSSVRPVGIALSAMPTDRPTHLTAGGRLPPPSVFSSRR